MFAALFGVSVFAGSAFVSLLYMLRAHGEMGTSFNAKIDWRAALISIGVHVLLLLSITRFSSRSSRLRTLSLLSVAGTFVCYATISDRLMEAARVKAEAIRGQFIVEGNQGAFTVNSFAQLLGMMVGVPGVFLTVALVLLLYKGAMWYEYADRMPQPPNLRAIGRAGRRGPS
jgi:hypothetical protein